MAMHNYLWHNKEQSGTLCSSPMSPSGQATTPGFISSHGGGSDITSSQKLAQRGVHGSNKLIFLGSKFGGPQKAMGKISLKPFLTFLRALSPNLKSLWHKKNPLRH